MYVAKYLLYVCALSKPNLNKYTILILIGKIQSSPDDDNNDNEPHSLPNGPLYILLGQLVTAYNTGIIGSNVPWIDYRAY